MRTEVSVFKRDKSYRDQLINFIPWSLNLSLELLYIFYEYWDEWLGSIKTELIFFYESKMIFKQQKNQNFQMSVNKNIFFHLLSLQNNHVTRPMKKDRNGLYFKINTLGIDFPFLFLHLLVTTTHFKTLMEINNFHNFLATFS